MTSTLDTHYQRHYKGKQLNDKYFNLSTYIGWIIIVIFYEVVFTIVDQAWIQDFCLSVGEPLVFQSIDEPNMDLKTFDNLKFIWQANWQKIMYSRKIFVDHNLLPKAKL